MSNPKPDLHDINAKPSWRKSTDIYLSSGNEKMDMWRADTSVKIDEICSLAIPNQISLEYQYTYQVWWRSIHIYPSYCPENTDIWWAGNYIKNLQNWPLAIPNQISIISMPIPSLRKSMDIYSDKLSSGKEIWTERRLTETRLNHETITASQVKKPQRAC